MFCFTTNLNDSRLPDAVTRNLFQLWENKMRKIVVLMHVTLDGFAAGPKGEMDWIHIDDEMFEDVDGMFTAADAALYGRVTYQMMEGDWPTVPGKPDSTDHVVRPPRWLVTVLKV